MNWIGLDVGGANLKVATLDGNCVAVPFPIWKSKDLLASKLRELLSPFKDHAVALTMTGELADCFESKREGVQFILGAVAECVKPSQIFAYQTSGKFCDFEVAPDCWQKLAASNWHALALYASRFMPDQTGTLIDVGSTTTDIVPFKNGKQASTCKTDPKRLGEQELVYTGVTRSAICGLLQNVQFDKNEFLLANELFATSLDAHVFLENISQSQDCEITADGRPATIRCSVKRLARMVCADPEEIDPRIIRVIAEATELAQLELIARAISKAKKTYPDCCRTFCLSGSGDWLAKKALKRLKSSASLLELGKLESPAVSGCAPAFAVAVLANERELLRG